ncbi:Golgi-associated RAB2 interactor protein 1A [Hippopotamus amphibius kiboko]|uniref:Golgi-associated RAB2 interactor protein 1A n=1 Tax=Hippopotamus amphibius kiboko TaxID=575201 RepID=UPI0025962DF9|nr:Golgi-associated RAB2 interactor protein 1A [Hippopotamus amphibius kiboko]
MSKIKGLPPEVKEPGPGVELGVEDGLLCQLVHSPEFNLFSDSVVFESNFIQVTKPGNWMDVCEGSTTVILGVTSSVPSLPLPNVLLMANVTWPQGQFSTWSTPGSAPVITLSRILPLKYVELRICDRLQRILRVRTVTEKIYYLRLHEKHPEAVFQFWIRLVKILQRGLSITTKDRRIQFSHCLVPKVPCGSTETSESSLPSSCQSSKSSVLLAAEQTSDHFSNLSGRSQLTADRNTDTAIEIGNFNCYDKTPSPVASPVNSNIPMRATLSHSLWEQENPDEYFL